MIKEITKHDIPECVNVIRTSFLTVADVLGFNSDNAPRFTAFATTEDRLMRQLENEHRPIYGYYENDRIIGYYSLALQENHECELNNLCVLPECRHKHIGEKLVHDTSDRAKSLDCIKMNIGIIEENTVLKKWYEMLGFQHIGTKKFVFFPFTCGYMHQSHSHHQLANCHTNHTLTNYYFHDLLLLCFHKNFDNIPTRHPHLLSPLNLFSKLIIIWIDPLQKMILSRCLYSINLL